MRIFDSSWHVRRSQCKHINGCKHSLSSTATPINLFRTQKRKHTHILYVHINVCIRIQNNLADSSAMGA